MHPVHPTLAQDLVDAGRGDTARRVAEVHLRAQALLRQSARPPSPSRLRRSTARLLAAAARRLVPGESLEELYRA